MADQEVYAGIDIGGTSIKFGLIDKQGKVLHRQQRPTLADRGATPLLHLVTNIGEQLMYYAAEENYEVRYLGVGTPGAVNARTGKIIGPSPNIPGWQGIELGETLRDRLNMTVWVDNDVNTMALAESRFGAATGADSVICVTLGTGVGGGVIINGKVWRGSTSSAGELGHMTINFDGPKCACGGKGHIESYCSSQAIIKRLKSRVGGTLTPELEEVLEGDLENLTVKKLFAALRKGCEVSKSVVEETADYLGIGLGGIVNLINPDTVVVGGGVSEGGGGFIEAVSASIRKHAFDSAVEKLHVIKASLGNDAGFIGAGLLGEDMG